MSFTTSNIRNIVVLGHASCGKSTLCETMLFEADEISRRGTIEDQSTVSDFTNIEKEKGISLFNTLLHVTWKDSKLNIIDTPGLDDFVGEVVGAMKVADTAMIVINGTNGVEVGTELVWEHIQANKTPALFVVSQMDHQKANFEHALESIQNRFGNKVLQFQYPLNPGQGFNQIIDALRMVMYVFPEDGGKPTKESIPESELQKAQELHSKIVEAAAENDEGLMEIFFEDGSLSEEELTQGLNIAMSKQQIYPVFCISATQNMGSGRIMGFINDICPAPNERHSAFSIDDKEIIPNSDENPTIFVYKTLSEPQVGQISYFKVFNGTLSTGDELINLSNQESERFSHVYIANGKNRTPINRLHAGDLGVAVKLKHTKTNDTLGSKDSNLIVKPIQFPSSKIRTAITTHSKNDMEKLMKALHQIESEDLTIRVEQNPQLKQTILYGQGQMHLDLVQYRLKKVNQVDMEFITPKIPYRETITTSSEGSYRHKKQSGGAGQFAEVHMRIEPWEENMSPPEGLNVRKTEIETLPWGGTLAFYWCIVGGSIDSKYINAIKKGILQRMKEGPLTGSACQNIRVCIFDGKMHAVDSNDMAFMIAAAQCFKDCFEAANPKLLEPIYKLSVLCHETNVGDIMADLQSRRAIIHGIDADGHYQRITAMVPLSELHHYSTTLRSLTQGKAKFTQEFAHYDPLSFDLQKQLIAEHHAEQED